MLGDRINDDGEAFAKHIQQLQQQVRQKLQASNEQSKIIKDAHQRYHIFNESVLVMVDLWKKRFGRGTYQKFKYNKIGPYKILIEINGNAYRVDLPHDLNISTVFNFLTYISSMGTVWVMTTRKEWIGNVLFRERKIKILLISQIRIPFILGKVNTTDI